MLKIATQQRTILSLLIVLALGILLKFYKGLGDEWLNNSASSIFYELSWCLLVFLFIPSRQGIVQIPVGVFVVTCVFEFLQLWHPPFLEWIRSYLLGRLLIGATFDWWDFLYYGIGCSSGWLWLRQISDRNL